MDCPVCLERVAEGLRRCAVCGQEIAPAVAAGTGVAPGGVPSPPPVEPRGEETPPETTVPFIGRRAELDRLRAVLAECGGPRPHLIVISGDAGMGKSRLFDEALVGLKAAPARIDLVAQPHGRAIAYGPFFDWVRARAAITPGMAPAQVDRRLRSLVEATGRLDPDDAAFVQAALGTPAGLARTQDLAPESFRRNLHRVFGRLIAARAGESGLCLVVDHAQWIDAATARWLDEALDGLVDCPLCVVALTRDRGAGWEPAAAPDAEIRLEPFSAEERSRLFEAITPALDFLPQLRERVIELAIGTPLFLGELARLVRQIMLENAGPIRPDQVADIIDVVPLSLTELIRRRIGRIDERARWVLDTAAILGPDCSLGLLECFDQIALDLTAHLRALEGRQIVDRYDGDDGPHYRFAEGYVGEVVYETLLDDQRQRLHRQVARVIEKAFGARLGEHLELLAYHYARAGETEPAIYYRVKAADRQYVLGESGAAAANYDRVLEEIETLRPTVANQTRLARVLTRQGRLRRFEGQVDEAFALLESARSLGERLGNAFLALQAQLEWAITALWHNRADEASALLEELATDARRLEVAEAECIILNSRGVLQWHAGRFEKALEAFRALAERARELGLGAQEADALNNTGLIYWRWSRYPEAAKAFRAASAIRMRLSDKFGLVAALLNLAIIQEQMAEIQPARRNYLQALDYARECGFVQGQATIEVNLSNLQRRAGQVSLATDHAARALDLARKIGDPLAEMTALENLGLSLAAARDYDGAVQRLRQALGLARDAKAAEKQVQIELDLLETAFRFRIVNPNHLARADELLRRIEAEGFRDMLAQACRIKGCVLNVLAESNDRRGEEYLELSLKYARQGENVFEEYETLKELLDVADETVPRETVDAWRTRRGRIEEMLEVGDRTERD